MGFSVATHSIRIVARRLSLPVRRVKQGLVCVLAVSILVLPRQQAVCQPVYREEVVESAILMSIAKFVEWPAHCFEHADSPLRVCVFGRDLMQKELMKWQGLTFLGRPIEVRVIFDLAELKKSAHRFHILYIADNEWRHTEQIISLIRSLPILSASDDDAF